MNNLWYFTIEKINLTSAKKSDLCSRFKMRKIFSLILCFFSLFSVISCKENVLDVNSSKHFFDLKAYAKAQAKVHSKQGMPVIKKVTKGEKSESATLTNLNWEQELEPIAESDLNRPSWKLHYDVDTTQTEDAYTITYTSNKEDLVVKRIVISLRKADYYCTSLSIEKSSTNFLYTSWQKIYYTDNGQLNIYGNLNMHNWINNNYATELTVVNTSEIQ